MANVRNLNSVFGNGNYRYNKGMNVGLLTFNSINELNLWYTLNSMYVCETIFEMNDLTSIYESLVRKFGYEVVYHKYVDYAGNDAAASLGQQTSSAPAVTEHITNMMDAVTSRLLMVNGMNYIMDSSYRDMSKDEVYKVLNDKHVNLDNLIGMDVLPIKDSKEVNIIFRDKGTGVEPERFTSTLLSTLKGNKKDINFLQGRFNIGSTGILRFCKGKFLLSRRSFDMCDSTGKYGFTFLRKAKLKDITSNRTSWEYMLLKDVNGNEFIPYITNETSIEYIYGKLGNNFDYGTAIKCFNLKAPSGITSNTAKLYKYIYASNLVRTYLPLSLCHIADNNAQNRNLLGRLNAMELLKKEDKDGSIFFTTHESLVPVDYEDDYVKSGDVKVNFIFYGFNQNVPDSVKDYLGKDRPCLILSLGGQTQGSLTCSELEANLNMPGFSRISKYCMFTVELDKVNPYLIDDIFGSNRQCFMITDFYDAMLNSICNFISHNQNIKNMIKNFSFDSSISVDLNKKISDYTKSLVHEYYPTLEKNGSFNSVTKRGESPNKLGNKNHTPHKGKFAFMEEDDILVSNKRCESLKINLCKTSSYKRITFSLPTNFTLKENDFKGSNPRCQYKLVAGMYSDDNVDNSYKEVSESDKNDIGTYPVFASSYVYPFEDTKNNNKLYIGGILKFHEDKIELGKTYFIHFNIIDNNKQYKGISSTLNVTFVKEEPIPNGDIDGKYVHNAEILSPNLRLISSDVFNSNFTSRDTAMKLLQNTNLEIDSETFWNDFDIYLHLDGYNLSEIFVNTDSKLFTDYLSKHYKSDKAIDGFELGWKIFEKAIASHLFNYNDIIKEENKLKKESEELSGECNEVEMRLNSKSKLGLMLKSVENSIRADYTVTRR